MLACIYLRSQGVVDNLVTKLNAERCPRDPLPARRHLGRFSKMAA